VIDREPFRFAGNRKRLHFAGVREIERRLKLVTFGLAFLTMHGTGFAQVVTVKASVDRDTIALGDSITFLLEVSASGAGLSGGHPTLPAVNGLSVVRSGSSDNVQIINGEMSVSRVYQFGLIPHKTGTFTIPSVNLEINGQVHSSNPVTFNVVAAGGGGASPNAGPEPSGEDDEPAPPPKPKRDETADVDPKALFLRARVIGPSGAKGAPGSGPTPGSPPKSVVFQGQPLVYSSKLYSQYSLAQGTGVKEEASFPGFLIENQPVDNRLREIIDRGARFQVADIARKILIPTRNGLLEVRPETMQVALQARRRRSVDPFGSMGSLFDDDFFFGRQIVTRFVTAPPIKVNVSPLPGEGRPADFSGTVGSDFVVTSVLDKPKVKENDVFTVKITISGHGDIRTVPEPKLDVGADFKLYPTKSTPKLDVSEAGLSGSKVFELVLAPRSAGEKTIPGVAFSYFDVDRGAYRTLRTEPLKVSVTPGEKEEALSSAQFQQSSEVKVLGRDIQYIKENSGPLVDEPELAASPLFLASNLLPFVLLTGVWSWERHRRRLEQDLPWVRRSRAHQNAKRQLAQLAALGESADTRTFFGRLEESVLEFLADKLNVPAQGLVVDRVEELLAGHSLRPETLARLKELLGLCEQARYAPEVAGGPKPELLESTQELLAELEGVLS